MLIQHTVLTEYINQFYMVKKIENIFKIWKNYLSSSSSLKPDIFGLSEWLPDISFCKKCKQLQ